MNKKYALPFALYMLFMSVFITSCKDDEYTISSGETLLNTFRILNAGLNGDVAAEGMINHADKYVEVRIPFETSLTELKFEGTVSEAARLVPGSGTVQDFSQERGFVVISGINSSVYKIKMLKNDPTEATLMNLRLVNASGTYYPAVINYKTNVVTVKVMSGYPTAVKADTIQVGPAGASYTISNLDAKNYFELTENPTITVEQGGKSKVYTIEVVRVPVGADFTKSTLAELTALKAAVPSVLGGSNNRDGHMANGTMYIPTRQGGNHVYYWNASKLFTGNSDASELSLEGMDFTGTAWGISSVYAVGEKVYVASMAMNKDQKLKVWYWANKTATPELILNYTIGDPEGNSTKVRLGDSFSVTVDNTGKGMLFFSNFPFQNQNNQFYVFDLTAHKQVNPTPRVIDLNLDGGKVGQYGRVNSIPNETDLYTVTGADMGIALIDGNGVVKHLVSADVIQGRAQDARIVYYNDARYLVYTVNREWEKGGTFGEIINISQGDNVVDALKMLNGESVERLKMNKLVIGSPNAADGWVSATSSAEVIGNQLYVMHFSTLSGFAIQRFDKAQ
ncbi:MAG: hypothetical protein RL662_699 [Bacteroidota bacterium]|jgi:hypothetical protein